MDIPPLESPWPSRESPDASLVQEQVAEQQVAITDINQGPGPDNRGYNGDVDATPDNRDHGSWGPDQRSEPIDGDHETGRKDDAMNKLLGINVDMAEGEMTDGISGEKSLGSRAYSGYALMQQLGVESNIDSRENSTGVGPHTPKIFCRYGRGCTHIYDPIHREKFWHPNKPSISRQELEECYICNECGYSTPSIQNLASHLRQKTAWTNQSLIGCHVSCLVDYKEWHEGIVTNYHKSGKHQFEFPNLDKTSGGNDSVSEVKESESEVEEHEENWDYCEEINVEYAYSQSVLFKIYGAVVQETGHKTRGHICLTDEDKTVILAQKGSLLYGELLPRGLNKALSRTRLNAGCATTLFDLGMGTGKVCIQSFLQYKNLEYVYGVELSVGRYNLAEQAALNMVTLLGKERYGIEIDPGRQIIVREHYTNENDQTLERILHFQCCSLFEISNISVADIIMLETDIPTELLPDLYNLLCKMHVGARVLSYLDFKKVWSKNILSFKQLDINRYVSDRYPTSWSVQRGHHLYIWTKVDSQATAYDENEYTKHKKSIGSHHPHRHVGSADPQRNTGDNDGGCFSMLRILQTFGFLKKRLFNGDRRKNGGRHHEDFSNTNEDDDCCEEYDAHNHRNAVNMPNNVVKKMNDESSFAGENSSIFVQQGDDTYPMTPKIVPDETSQNDDNPLRTSSFPAFMTPPTSPEREVGGDSMNTPLDIKRSMSPYRDSGNTTPKAASIKPLKLPSFTESNHTLMIDGTVAINGTVRGNKYCIIS